LNASGATAGLGLLSAASWGGSDFAGGMGARRGPALLVTVSGHAFSFLVLLALCLSLHLAPPGANSLVYAAAGGFEGALALAIFYRALAMGAMGLTAAITGLLTALVPVVFSAFRYGLPTPLTGVGLATGCAAIWLITHRPELEAASQQVSEAAREGAAVHDAGTPAKALLFGALAGVGFGLQLILFKFAGAGGVLWVMTAARAAGVAAVVLVLLFLPAKATGAIGAKRSFWLIGVLAGCLDTVGNLLYLRASQLGRLDVAAVICSLYPAFTILLAALLLRERPTRRQIAGMAMALAAVVLLSLSGLG
jgi:drug/metabolite transporter (DMT)-like permease